MRNALSHAAASLGIALCCTMPTRTSAAQTQASTGKPAATAHSAGALTVASFKTKGLNYETELMALYLGDFDHARMKRDGASFDALFGNFLRTYASMCDADLPKNKVEMTTPECQTWSVTYNGYGAEINRVCVRYVDVGTGLYADPDLYAAYGQVDSSAGMDMARNTIQGLMKGGSGMGATLHSFDAATSVGDDIKRLLHDNGCSGPGMRRFQDNLLRFALGQQPLRLPGGETLATLHPKAAPGTPFQDSDYTRLVDDLITENSRGWMMNRYVAGSVSNAFVDGRDSQGRPSIIRADYAFVGMNGRTRGSVKLVFSDGLPQCLYFADIPDACRGPSRRIMTKYENGGYALSADEQKARVAPQPTAPPRHPLLRPGVTVSANGYFQDIPRLPLYHQELQKLDGQILICSYANPEGQGGESNYYYWKDRAPPNIGLLLAMQTGTLDRVKDHAVSVCPAEEQQASALSASPPTVVITPEMIQQARSQDRSMPQQFPQQQSQTTVSPPPMSRNERMQQQIELRNARMQQQQAINARVRACGDAMRAVHVTSSFERTLVMQTYRQCLQAARRPQ